MIVNVAGTGLPKSPSGIQGLDEITGGGLPSGRPTLICGGPGCGKTLFGMEFLVRGATDYDEPGVFVSFEEKPEDLVQNVASLGWDLKRLQAEGKFLIEFIQVERSEIEETGEYDLEGLFIRLGAAVDEVKAKRIVLDTVESLFASLPNELILRSELRRLFRWIKDRGLTAVVTGERGEKTLTRYGIEEYVSDCVIDLNVRVVNDIATRRVRVVKYRGTAHRTNEYPFLIDADGFSVLPITSLGLDYEISTERVSSGIERLDTMLGGQGYLRGSSILVSGTAGTGKSSLAAAFAKSTCERGGRCLYFAFEEPAGQIVRNMRSIGLDLGKLVEGGKLRIQAARPTSLGMEMHLVAMFKAIRDFEPEVVIVDPISSLAESGAKGEVKSILMRLVDYLKGRGVTTLFTDLISGQYVGEFSETAVSSLMDTWILLRNIESGGERNRAMFVLKARGTAHSNQVREFILSPRGIELADAYLGPEGVLMGSARVAQGIQLQAEAEKRDEELRRRRRLHDVRQAELKARIAALGKELAAADEEMEAAEKEAKALDAAQADERKLMALARKAD